MSIPSYAPHGRLTWWCKLEWFAPWNRDLRPVLWIDLDTYMFHVEPFEVADTGEFWMIDNFNAPRHGESGLMVIPKDVDHIWSALLQISIRPSAADACFLRNFAHKRLNRVVDGIYSYKRHCKERLPADANAVCFHGEPKPPDTKGWSKLHWQALI